MPDAPLPLDGITSPAPADTVQDRLHPPASEHAVKRWKTLIISFLSVTYFFYTLWSLFLISTLPTTNESLDILVDTGIIVAIAVGFAFLCAGVLLLMHVGQTKPAARTKRVAIVKSIAYVLPGILISIATPLAIIREPALSLDVLTNIEGELVAPVTLSFSAQHATEYLARNGFSIISYRWDINGDGKTDQETSTPELTATFEKDGLHIVRVTMVNTQNLARSARRMFTIRRAVFSVTPFVPIVRQPVAFGLQHLYPNDGDVQQVEWDFDGDGKFDESGTKLSVSTTYYRTGSVTVSARVTTSNNTQVSYQRTIVVEDPPPLPFPVSINTDPSYLVSTSPFTVLFTVETEEPLVQVLWNFGDGKKEEGRSVAHTFSNNGSFGVQAKVYSQSGSIAEITKLVEVVNQLNLYDLSFEGTPEVRGGRISGEVPLSINIKPVTKLPFIQFFWEAPKATEIGSTKDTLQAIYRREGTYNVTLIAQDAERRILRMPITVVVQPPSSSVQFLMEPSTGAAPLHVKFDASETTIPDEDINGFIWNFGDGSDDQYGGAFAEHTYEGAGTYTATVTATTASGKQVRATKTVVVRAPVLKSCIFPSRKSGLAPLAVAFNAACSEGERARVLWDFGDGAQNDEEQTVHIFERAGTYTVRLTVWNAKGDTHSSNVTISVQAP